MPFSKSIAKPEKLPTLAELVASNAPDVPSESAWIWGPEDEIGRINLLDEENTLKAMKEVKFGTTVSLNWDMTLPLAPDFGRPPIKHKIVNLNGHGTCNDDYLDMNTQSGSQWDGLRHFGHQTKELMYNNLKADEIHGENKTLRCGINKIADHGIVGRGVLIDYAAWAEKEGIEFDAFERHPISLDVIKTIAAEEGVEFQVGDILLVRSGWMKQYNAHLAAGNLEKIAGKAVPTVVGVDQTEEMKVWLHDSYFAAVGGDSPTFEAWPAAEGVTFLHEYLLPYWGVIVGEMLELEDLAEQCRKNGKWTFVVTSAPLNTPGGISTLANALAIL
ncbi:putative cyclase-domain-containing protein [Dipodascopsis tothii]|uniref:putative cyclase-domain-containing protein n=1 Tax=Dipodascopsis tothii TaxID=44089 RepID=UPI0034CE5312